jgi:ABC-type transport system substrate-binding protein
MAQPPTNALDVRRAIAYAVDMQTLSRAYHGLYPRAGSFLPPMLVPWYDPSIKPFPFEPAKTRALLRGRTIDATLVSADLNSTIVQEVLGRAGFNVTLKRCVPAVCNAPDGPFRTGKFTIALSQWIGGADPEQSIIFLCSQATIDGDNNGRFCDPQFERLFANSQTTISTAQRIRDYWGMQRIIRDRVAIVPLFYLVGFDGVSKRVSGFARNMLYYPVSPELWSVQ